MGTGWRVRLARPPHLDPAALRRDILARLAGLVAEMSQWEPDSHLSRFNRAPAGSWADLPPDFATVIACALAIAEQSDGAFDPTLGRAAALLGFGASVPAGDDLAAAQAESGWRRLTFDPAARRLRQPGGLWLDLSGIAKGYAVDAVAALLAERGIRHFLVEIGGELVGRGVRPDGEPWWVALESPPGMRLAPLHIALHELAVATSGDYRRGAHTIDPATGRPLAAGVISVSVIHESAMLADGWATALTTLGPARGIALATEKRIAARIVIRAGPRPIEHLSPAFAAMLED
ncbi:FAD:protein FMN transferase [Sphingomonas sp. BIUV-7]|uniref:FAD:protein FMN transferase n=1 Tax=Sphingomonas natans TaxID=3063330 RepID=A0ABT8YEF4_9SPHN|nr:FAD:protein FMN transferase [Sphingomonas sp. BIUV-7]MDO6416696.1 FAD:protein FMN transferase [Sphingomonas sp. BIUV-7]